MTRSLLAILAVPAVVLLALVAVAAVRRPRLALVALVVVAVTGVQAPLAQLGVPRAFLGALAVAVLATVRVLRRGERRLQWSPVYLAGSAWIAAQAVSATAAVDQARAFSGLLDYLLAAAVVVCVAALTSTDEDRRAACVAAVGSLTVLALLTVAQEGLGNTTTFHGFSVVADADPGGFARHSGPLTDSNFWGRNLVLVLPLALWLAITSMRRRALWWSSALVLLVATYLSGSRGAFVAFVVAVALWLLLSGRVQRGLLIATPFLVGAFAFLPGVAARIGELGQVSAVLNGQGDPSLVGRLTALRDGVQIALDHPATGVGPGNFVVAVARRQQEVGSSSTEQLAAHNVFLQMAAEAGLPGLATWLALCLVVAAVLALALLTSSTSTSSDRRARGLVVALLAGTGGWLAASAFLHLNSLPTIAVVLGVCVAASQRVQEPSVATEVADRVRSPHHWRNVAAGTVAVALVLELSVLALSGTVAAALRPRWQASLQLILTPRGSNPDPYPVSLSSRLEIVSTYADVVMLAPAGRAPGATSTGPGVRVQARPTQDSSVITLHAIAVRRRDAAGAVTARARTADRYLRSSGSFFALPVGGRRPVLDRTGSPAYPPAVYLAGQLVVALVTISVARRLAR